MEGYKLGEGGEKDCGSRELGESRQVAIQLHRKYISEPRR